MRTFVLLIIILICTLPSHSQQVKFQNNMNEKVPGIYVKKKNKKRVYKISEGTKIRCKTNNSSTITGKIYGVKDSSIVIENIEIPISKIKSITECDGTEALCIGFSPFTYGVSLILIPFIITKYNFGTKWEFYTPFKTGIDSALIKKIIAKREIDSVNESSTSKFSVTLYPLNSLVNQHSLELGYQINKKYYLGIEAGYIKADCWWNGHHQLYNGTDGGHPIGYYNGWSIAVHYKLNKINKRYWNLELVPFYKHMTYDHISFTNCWGDSHPVESWIRSENLNVYGLKIMMGKKILRTNYFILQAKIGLSIRKRFREYYNYWVYAPYVIDGRTNIWIHEDKIFPGIQAGLSLGLGNFKQK